MSIDDESDPDRELLFGEITCPIRGADMNWHHCWECHGEGGWHDCGEDCCPCLDKEEVTVLCDNCDGEGGYLICVQAKSHPDMGPQLPERKEPTS